jgi:rhodanese-related sulfurtransferase
MQVLKTMKNSFLPNVRRFSTINKDILIGVKEAGELFKANKSVFIDTRDPSVFAEGHIPGARNVNEIFTYLSTSDEKGIKEMTSTFEKLFQKAGLNGNEHVITYEECLKTRFGASCRGYYLLKLFGHNNVNVLNGGWESWVKEGLPVTKSPQVFQKAHSKLNGMQMSSLDKKMFLRLLENLTPFFWTSETMMSGMLNLHLLTEKTSLPEKEEFPELNTSYGRTLWTPRMELLYLKIPMR